MVVSRVTPALAKRIELWPIDQLMSYAENLDMPSGQQVDRIAASMVEVGFCDPIVVDSANGIVAGHGRLLAARRLGWAEVPVIVLDHLTETQRRACLLTEDRLSGAAGWGEELLALEPAELADADLDPQEIEVFLADHADHAIWSDV